MTDGGLRVHDDGIDLAVRLTPKADRDAVEGGEQTADGRRHLKCRVRAVPEKGKANTALERLLAEAFGVPRSAVAIVAGGTARLKTARIAGDPPELRRRALDLMAG